MMNRGSRGLDATCRGDTVQVRRSGGTVDERDAVEQERGREGAEEEILHRRFARDELAFEEPGQNVQRERHELERQEHDDQVARGGHQHHAGGREQHERPVLARLRAGAAEIVHREQDDERARVADHHVEEQREVVEHDHVAEGAARRAPPHDGREQRADHAGERHHRRQLAGQRAPDQVEHEHERGSRQHDERRRERADEHLRKNDGVHA
jgi:hypothetical protein